MAIDNYGLSKTGFKRKRLPEILDNMHSRFCDKSGLELANGSNSVLGMTLGIIGYEIADLWTAANDTYNAMYPNTSLGVSLTNSAGLAGIVPISAEHSTLIATCYGDDGTSIPKDSQISSSGNSDITYSCTDRNMYIDRHRASYIELVIANDVIPNAVYIVEIDNISKSYTANSGDTKTNILSGLLSQLSFTDKTVTIINDVLIISMIDQSKTMVVDTSNVEIQSVGSPFNFKCDAYGAINPSIGSVNNILTAYIGWNSVVNKVSTVVGRNAESDIEIRQNWNKSLYQRASAMIEAIRAAILKNVTGVETCLVFENTKDETDESGRPPHSIEVIVIGGNPDDIVSEIWTHKAGGIDTFGKQSAIAIDSMNMPHTIYFNRPEEVKVWLKVTLNTYADEMWVSTNRTNTVNSILETASELISGQDVVLQRLLGGIYKATNGVGVITITATTGDTPGEYSDNTITITDRQVAVFDTSRIEVVESV